MNGDTGSKKKYKYFRGSFTIGRNPDGKPKRIFVYGKTEKERDEKLAVVKEVHRMGLNPETVTILEWAERWMELYKAGFRDML